MSTQTLRGMVGNGPDALARRPDRGDATDRQRQARKPGVGVVQGIQPGVRRPGRRETELPAADMQAFTDFVMALKMPPNPVRALDNSLSPDAAGRPQHLLHQRGHHRARQLQQLPNARPGNGRFGTAGLMTFEGLRITENFKVPQLRNVYQKAGMFGFSRPGANTGPQIRGFGFSNDGSIDTLDTFFSDPVFRLPQPVATTRAQVGAFVIRDGYRLRADRRAAGSRGGPVGGGRRRRGLALLKQQANGHRRRAPPAISSCAPRSAARATAE
jgi:hypothetical protein